MSRWQMFWAIISIDRLTAVLWILAFIDLLVTGVLLTMRQWIMVPMTFCALMVLFLFLGIHLSALRNRHEKEKSV